MALVHNPNWIGFDGTPVTGRVPVNVVMMAGDMTPALQAEVQHVYLMFCLAKNVAVVDYFVTDRRLADGSRVRITSMQDRDTVQVWTKKAVQPVLLGFEALQFSWDQLRARVFSEVLAPTWQGIYTTPRPAHFLDYEGTPDQGYVSWSNPAVMVGNRQIQVTYGERAQPSYHFGLYGTDRLWIDGSRVKLFDSNNNQIGFAITAACLVKVSYAGNVGYILRVMRADSFYKQLYFMDFGLRSNQQPIPNIGALGDSIELRERVTRPGPAWWAADYFEAQVMPDFGWGAPLTRFCFNASGSKVACSAILWDEAVETTRTDTVGRFKGSGIVEIDALTGALTKKYPGVTDDTVVSHIAAASGWLGSYSSASRYVRTSLVAVDYSGDELVWVMKMIALQSSTEYNKPSGSSANSTQDDEITTSVLHSKLGKLLELTHKNGVTMSAHATGPLSGAGSIKWRGGSRYMDISFGGDLSRGGFCIGYVDALSIDEPTGSYESLDDRVISFKGGPMPLRRVRMKFDVYLKHSKVWSGLPGASVFRRLRTINEAMFIPHSSQLSAEGEDVVVADVGRGGIELDGILYTPEDNGTYTQSTKLRLASIPDYPLLSTLPLLRVGGFFNYLDAPYVFCAVAPSGNAIHMNSMDEAPNLAGQNWPGLSHLVRQGVRGWECFAMSYEGFTATEIPEHYIQSSFGGLFLNHRRVYP